VDDADQSLGIAMDYLKDAFNNCDFEKPLDWDDRRRVDLSAPGVRGGAGSCIDFLRTNIELSGEPAYQLFTGFRGSGKSTELKLLARQLRQKGYSVIYVDTESYLNLRVPARVSDLLISMAAGVDSYLETACSGAGERRIGRFWERLHRFLGAEVKVDQIQIGIPSVGQLQMSLKQDPGFKQALDAALEKQGRISQLAQECLGFFDEALATISKHAPNDAGVVLIVDSFEKLRGDLRNAEDVRESAEHIFIRDAEFLRVPFNAIYTVPPWMAFVEFGAATGFGLPYALPMCKVHDAQSGEAYEPGIQAMMGLLERRVDRTRLFASPNPLRELIAACGGYPRDLLRMVRELIVRMRMREARLPAEDQAVAELVQEVMDESTSQYDQAITDESLDLLVRVARERNIRQHTREEIHCLADLFDHHFILSYRNGKPWYDVHPLVRRGARMTNALSANAETSGKPS